MPKAQFEIEPPIIYTIINEDIWKVICTHQQLRLEECMRCLDESHKEGIVYLISKAEDALHA